MDRVPRLANKTGSSVRPHHHPVCRALSIADEICLNRTRFSQFETLTRRILRLSHIVSPNHGPPKTSTKQAGLFVWALASSHKKTGLSNSTLRPYARMWISR